MKRPLFLCLIGLVLGEAAAISFGWKGDFFLVLVFLPAEIYRRIWQKNRNHFFLLFILSVSAGFLFFMREWERKDVFLEQQLPAQGYIYGKIAFQNINQEGGYVLTLKNVRFAEKAEGFERDKGAENVRGSCQVTGLEEKSVSLLPGDCVLCKGRLTQLSQPTNPGEFNGDVYYRSRGITCQFFADACILKKEGDSFLLKNAYLVKERIAGAYAKLMGKEHAALLNAMVLGDKTDLSREQKQLYEENGVAHLLAVSGLHVSIVAGSWFKFLRKRRASYAVSCFSGVCLLLFYGAMTGFGNSVIRASVMYGVFLGSEYWGTDYDMASAMSLAGIAMLLESPWRVLEGGCQLSFSAVFAIGVVLPKIKELASKREKKEEGRIRRFSLLRKKVKEGILASAVISAVTLPVILRVFYECSPYNIFWNLLVIPCMAPLMVSGMLGGAAGMICLPLAKIICFPAEAVLSFFHIFLSQARRLPGAVIVTGCPSWGAIAGFYILEGALLFLWYYRSRKYWFRFFGVCLLILLFWRQEDSLHIAMLDVGQGECILLRTVGGETVLIDGGSTSRSKVGEYVIEPALKYYGAARLDYVLVSHGDEDHISGIRELFEMGYPVKTLLLPEGREEDDNLQMLVKQAKRSGTKILSFGRKGEIRFPEMTMRCLHPFSGFDAEDRNAASMVIHLQYKEFDALFTGDIEEKGEDVLCRQDFSGKINGRLELLKVAHHGSRYSTGEKFLKLSAPEAAWISSGRNNRYGHPHEELLKRLENLKIAVWQTKENGALFLETNGKRWELTSFTDDQKRFYIKN